ncbi:hypothetical protein BIW11_03472 [Tropilaelaps mercedesae]|uniref:Uncharacterized protein n=1 Tax=Tropilaelaps mercedesae TaxID=418985 RepID=A0A1V9XKR8_9ACAR|nr:hypothetical protein BIW11_03472 [Tropilaelaps mercedesae]
MPPELAQCDSSDVANVDIHTYEYAVEDPCANPTEFTSQSYETYSEDVNVPSQGLTSYAIDQNGAAIIVCCCVLHNMPNKYSLPFAGYSGESMCGFISPVVCTLPCCTGLLPQRGMFFPTKRSANIYQTRNTIWAVQKIRAHQAPITTERNKQRRRTSPEPRKTLADGSLTSPPNRGRTTVRTRMAVSSSSKQSTLQASKHAATALASNALRTQGATRFPPAQISCGNRTVLVVVIPFTEKTLKTFQGQTMIDTEGAATTGSKEQAHFFTELAIASENGCSTGRDQRNYSVWR